MKKKSLISLVLLVLVSLVLAAPHDFSGVVTLTPQTHEISDNLDKKVYAFYYLWPNDWRSAKMRGEMPLSLW